MKNLVTLLFFFVLLASISFGQEYKKGTNNLSLGIGPGLAGIYGNMDMPSISLGYQAGILEKISVGGIAGYSSSSYGVIGYKWTYSYMFIGARGEYHFVDVDLENFDLYGGLTLGYNIVSVSEPSGYSGFYSAGGSYLIYGFHAGGRYFFSPNLGAFVELGYGVGYLVAGITYRL